MVGKFFNIHWGICTEMQLKQLRKSKNPKFPTPSPISFPDEHGQVCHYSGLNRPTNYTNFHELYNLCREVIERCFRSLKRTQIKMNPMYHWVDRRIESHVRICVLTLKKLGIALPKSILGVIDVPKESKK